MQKILATSQAFKTTTIVQTSAPKYKTSRTADCELHCIGYVVPYTILTPVFLTARKITITIIISIVVTAVIVDITIKFTIMPTSTTIPPNKQLWLLILHTNQQR